MLQPPLLTPKPPNPTPTLPIPKRKGVALMIIGVPVVIGSLAGWLAGYGLRMFVSGLPLVPFSAIGGFFGAVIGGLLGIRTLLEVLLYGATQRPRDGADPRG